jgi:hypothetical protein
MAGAATGRHREIRNMTGFLQASQRTKAKTKALGKREKQTPETTPPPKCVLTTGNIVIDRMTLPNNNLHEFPRQEIR